jgi:hypothetical protein
VALCLAALVLLLGSATAAAAPSLGGSLTRGPGNGLRATIQNNGDAPFQFFRLMLNQQANISSVTIVSGPQNAQCNGSGNQIGCAFQTNPEQNLFDPGETLIIDFQTNPLYPDNGGAQAFGCPSPCGGPQDDVGPFSIPGPAPSGGGGGGGTGTQLPAGFDLFETDPQNTIFNFSGAAAIPPGVICPTCGGFQGMVNFGGRPPGMFMGQYTGDGDTFVRRGAAVLPPGGAPSGAIPIELVSLSLVSVQPIMVSTQSGDRFFDVFVDLSAMRPSQGQMQIAQQSASGGTFDSQLMVIPKFTFVPRDGQGQPTTLDIGAFPPNPAIDEALNLRQTGGVWRAGCVAPALSVPPLSTGFCPGLTPGGQKQLTVEASALARHGIYPAQPALEHFQCYKVRSRRRQPRQVQLVDQFGASTKQAARRTELCNPVKKNNEPFRNRRAHLQCYAIRGTQAVDVAVRNQFGPSRLRTTKASRLCLPSKKFRGKRPSRKKVVFTDHFQCYAVQRVDALGRKVQLRDQFGRAQVTVGRPRLLCNPVQKNNTRVQHPVQHLVCYAINKRRFQPRKVKVRNQFGRKQPVKAFKPVSLCVPSLKLRLQPNGQPVPPG